MGKHNREQARERFIKRKMLVVPLGISLPGLEDLDGEIGVIELSATDLDDIEELGKDSDGKVVDALGTAATVARGLVLLETRERLFDDKELKLVAGFGLSVNAPVNMLIRGISSMTEEMKERIKERLKKIREDASSSSSTETSEQPEAASA